MQTTITNTKLLFKKLDWIINSQCRYRSGGSKHDGIQ